LTFQQALDSEKVEKERVQDKLPEQLQKAVLLHLQFRKQKQKQSGTQSFSH
jgi:bromodomain adjacent to zinc finger domain protein 1A